MLPKRILQPPEEIKKDDEERDAEEEIENQEAIQVHI